MELSGMSNFKIRINPATKEVDYTIEGNYDDLLKIDYDKIKEMNKIVKKIVGTFDMPSKKDHEKSTYRYDPTLSQNNKPDIVVPSNIVENVEKLDDRQKIPILWNFSSKPIMPVGEFLTAAAAQGFSLSPTWHPSAGGNFATKLVSEDKMFREREKKGKEKTWELTNVGKLKITAELKKLEKSTT